MSIVNLVKAKFRGSTKNNIPAGEATIPFTLPTTVEEAMEMYGEDTILALLNRTILNSLQTAIRAKLAEGLEQLAIKNIFKDWLPTIGRVKKTDVDKAEDLFLKLNKDEQGAMLTRLDEARKASTS